METLEVINEVAEAANDTQTIVNDAQQVTKEVEEMEENGGVPGGVLVGLGILGGIALKAGWDKAKYLYQDFRAYHQEKCAERAKEKAEKAAAKDEQKKENNDNNILKNKKK